MNSVICRDKIMILGLGGAGGRVVQTLSGMKEAAGLMFSVFDTDRAALDKLTLLPDSCKVLCDEQWLSGQGTGGDVMKGQRALSRENGKLQTLIREAALLITVGGLGGGTATGGAGVICRLARHLSVPCVSLFELPFAFEGHGRVKCAEDGLRELLTLTDAVMGIPNDLLFSVLPAETGFAEAFDLADQELARTVLGLVDILLPGNLLSADLGDLSAILKNRKNYAAVGVGIGRGDTAAESCTLALSALVDSPFLGGAAKLKEADAVIINLTGGETLTLAEVKRTLENAGTLPGLHARVLMGANVREGMNNEVHLTAVAVKYDDREAAAAQLAESSKPVRRRRSAKSKEQPVQQSLPLTIASSGIFEGMNGTIVDGVNLDIPAFSRNQIPVDTGE